MAHVVRALARSPVNRAVHLSISPRPADLAESSGIMRYMQQFGEIEYYKSLKYDTIPNPKSALVIFHDENAAKECLRQSPLRVRLSKGLRPEPISDFREDKSTTAATSVMTEAQFASVQPAQRPASNEDSSIVDVLGSWGLDVDFLKEPEPRYGSVSDSKPVERPTKISEPFLNPPPPSESIPEQDEKDAASSNTPREELESESAKSHSKLFSILSSPATHNFRDHINNSRFANSYMLDTKTAAQRDLVARVPHAGMSDLDWRPVVPWRHTERMREEAERKKTMRQLYDEVMAEDKARAANKATSKSGEQP